MHNTFIYFRSLSESPKEVRRWRKKRPMKNTRTKRGRHPFDFRASTSALSTIPGHQSTNYLIIVQNVVLIFSL